MIMRATSRQCRCRWNDWMLRRRWRRMNTISSARARGTAFHKRCRTLSALDFPLHLAGQGVLQTLELGFCEVGLPSHVDAQPLQDEQEAREHDGSLPGILAAGQLLLPVGINVVLLVCHDPLVLVHPAGDPGLLSGPVGALTHASIRFVTQAKRLVWISITRKNVISRRSLPRKQRQISVGSSKNYTGCPAMLAAQSTAGTGREACATGCSNPGWSVHILT
jgi:hypothetical protein